MFFFLFQLAKLSPDDMNVVNNMRLLEGASDTKKASLSGFALKFDGQKVNIYGSLDDTKFLKSLFSARTLFIILVSRPSLIFRGSMQLGKIARERKKHGHSHDFTL